MTEPKLIESLRIGRENAMRNEPGLAALRIDEALRLFDGFVGKLQAIIDGCDCNTIRCDCPPKIEALIAELKP